MNLEQLFSPRGLNLPLSPLQRAICRAADGRPLDGVLDEAAMLAHFGTTDVPEVAPSIVTLVCGVRSGKSILAGGIALRSALACDLSPTQPHEVPRAVVVAPSLDNAMQTFALCIGAVRASPVLSRFLVGEPTADSFVIRRPDRRLVEITVVAASRGARGLRSRWLAAAVLEEAALFAAESTGAVVHAEDLLRAAEPRILPGGQVAVVSSPFGPEGLLWELHREGFGKPSPRLLVVHAPTRAMNPAFDTAKIEALRRTHPDVAAREYDAQWLEPDTAFLDAKTIDACTRDHHATLPPRGGVRYVAATDAATRGNAWTLVLAHAEDGVVIVDLVREWVGSKVAPLSPREVLTDIASVLGPYGVRQCLSDRWSIDALRDIGHAAGIHLEEVAHTAERRLEAWLDLRARLATSGVELPADETLSRDLLTLRRRVNGGSMRIDLPLTGDGRHCDYAPALLLAVDALSYVGGGARAFGPTREFAASSGDAFAGPRQGLFGGTPSFAVNGSNTSVIARAPAVRGSYFSRGGGF